MSFKIAGPKQSEWSESPFRSGQPIPEENRSEDPFVRSAQLYNFAFLDELLTARIAEQMKGSNNFKDMGADFLKMLAVQGARGLREAFSTFSRALLSSSDIDSATDIKNRYPAEYEIVAKAFRLRYNGKSNEEILEILNGKSEAEGE